MKTCLSLCNAQMEILYNNHAAWGDLIQSLITDCWDLVLQYHTTFGHATAFSHLNIVVKVSQTGHVLVLVFRNTPALKKLEPD